MSDSRDGGELRPPFERETTPVLLFRFRASSRRRFIVFKSHVFVIFGYYHNMTYNITDTPCILQSILYSPKLVGRWASRSYDNILKSPWNRSQAIHVFIFSKSREHGEYTPVLVTNHILYGLYHIMWFVYCISGETEHALYNYNIIRETTYVIFCLVQGAPLPFVYSFQTDTRENGKSSRCRRDSSVYNNNNM